MQIICKEIFTPQQTGVKYGKSSTIEGQDYKLEDLIARFSQGQRLTDINIRDLDLETPNNPSDSEDTENPPIFEDMVDFVEFQKDHNERKKAFKERLATKKAEKEKKGDDEGEKHPDVTE